MAGKHSQKVTPCPESQQITVFLQHALSINAKGYFGLRTGNKSQHAIFLLRTAGRHSLSPDTRYLQVPAPGARPWPLSAGCSSWSTQPTPGIRYGVTQPNARGLLYETRSPSEARFARWGLVFLLPSAKLQVLIHTVGSGGWELQRKRGGWHGLHVLAKSPPPVPALPCGRFLQLL